MTPEMYNEKLSTLKFPNAKWRVFSSVLLNMMDICVAPLLLLGMSLPMIGKDPSAGIVISLFAISHLGLQVYLATKGYTISKVILGRKVLDVNTLEKASVHAILIRPIVAQFWMYVMFGLSFFSGLLGVAFSSLFRADESNPYNRAYNDAVTTSMAVASTGFFWKTMAKYPKVVWLHDTLFKTVVVSVPHSIIFKELKNNNTMKAPVAHSKPVDIKKAA